MGQTPEASRLHTLLVLQLAEGVIKLSNAQLASDSGAHAGGLGILVGELGKIQARLARDVLGQKEFRSHSELTDERTSLLARADSAAAREKDAIDEFNVALSLLRLFDNQGVTVESLTDEQEQAYRAFLAKHTPPEAEDE